MKTSKDIHSEATRILGKIHMWAVWTCSVVTSLWCSSSLICGIAWDRLWEQSKKGVQHCMQQPSCCFASAESLRCILHIDWRVGFFWGESSDTRWKVLRWCHHRTASNPCGISSGTLSWWNNLKYVLSFGWNDGKAGIKLHGPYDRLHCEAIG